jgi:hypothetical protein
MTWVIVIICILLGVLGAVVLSGFFLRDLHQL